MQDVADGHDTPFRMTAWPPAGAGVCWIDHEVPSHRSASGELLDALSSEDPTAMQALAEVHDTLLRKARAAPAGRGTGWMDHEVPFHRSASGPWPPEVTPPNPTPMQLLAEVQDTPARPLSPWPTAGGRIDHAVPFHTSASGTAGELPAIPTATHEIGRAHV